MVNAWSLAGSIMNGTFEEDYPLMDKKLYIYESPDGGKTVTRREPFSDKREVIQGDYFEEITWSDVEDKGIKTLIGLQRVEDLSGRQVHHGHQKFLMRKHVMVMITPRHLII